MSTMFQLDAGWGVEMRTIDALQNAIEARKNLLAGETGEKAVVATAINILRSLRAETNQVGKNPVIIGDRWLIKVERSQYIAGWASPGKHNPRGRRVFRTSANGHALDRIGPGRKRIVNLVGRYTRGEQVQTFRGSATNLLSRDPGTPFYSRYFAARSQEDVEAFLVQRIKKRIGQYRGISRRALGLAMHKVAGTATTSATSSLDMDRLLGQAVTATVRVSGYNSGEASVSVMDALPAATLALKNGAMSLDIAIKRAVNATAAIINKRCDVPLHEQIKTPFPEVRRRAS